MTSQNRSFPTAAEAIEQIRGWAAPSLQRRRTLVTAVHTLCRVDGEKAPSTVRLDPNVCLPLLDDASHVALGISKRTHGEMRTGLRRVLRGLGLLAPVRQGEVVSDPAWAGLIAQLPARFHPHRLHAFMEHCAAGGIAPSAVNGATLANYLEYRVASRGGPNLRSDVREVARQWNRMRGLIPDWPSAELVLAPLEGRVQALPFTAYPTTLQAGVEAYLAELGRDPEDELDGDGEGRAAFSPETVETRKKGVRLLLWGLVETGRAPDTLVRLAELVECDVARKTLAWHRKRLGNGKPTYGTAMLGDTVQSLAAHVGLDGEALDRLRRMLRGVRPKKQTEIGDELDALLGRLKQPEVEERLLFLPHQLLCKARRLRDGWTSPTNVNHPPDPREACWMAALAAAIEIVLNLPLRIHDLSRLRLGEEIRFVEMARNEPPEGRLRVVAAKNNHIVESVLRGDSAAIVWEYVQAFRPLGPHPDTLWMFPNRDRADGPRTKNGFGGAIAGAVAEHTGVRVNVHAFRAFAATCILEDNPHAIEDVRVILGHSTFEMAMRHYRRSNRAAAAERLTDGLAKRRGTAHASSAGGLPFDLGRRRRRVA